MLDLKKIVGLTKFRITSHGDEQSLIKYVTGIEKYHSWAESTILVIYQR